VCFQLLGIPTAQSRFGRGSACPSMTCGSMCSSWRRETGGLACMGFAKQHAEQHPDQTPFRITCIEAHSTTCMKQQHTVLCGWHQSSSMPSRDLDASCRTVGHGSLCCAGVVCWGSHIWRHPAQQEDAGMAHHACGSGASHRAGHTAAASGMLSYTFAAKPASTSKTCLCQEGADQCTHCYTGHVQVCLLLTSLVKGVSAQPMSTV